MRRMYEYAHLMLDRNVMEIRTTEPQEMDVLLARVKEWDAHVTVATRALPSGETYYYHIQLSDEHDTAIGWWILKHLCERGWEPFAADGILHHYLRKVLEA